MLGLDHTLITRRASVGVIGQKRPTPLHLESATLSGRKLLKLHRSGFAAVDAMSIGAEIPKPVTALNARECWLAFDQEMSFSRPCHSVGSRMGVSHDESEFTHRPAGGVSRERRYVLQDKQHRLRYRTEFPIFGCTTRAILESTSLDIW
jgi:hypothetical protein